MAFTISHMAAAIPFYRSNWLNFEALLIGTMLPDLPYVLGSYSKLSQQSHDWLGVISYCLPSGLIVFALWHWLLRPAIKALIIPWLVGGDYIVIQEPKIYRAKEWLIFWSKVTLAIMLGAGTHLIWDGTTHSDGFIVQQFAWLQSDIKLPYLDAMSVARFLQYLTSLIGLILLIGFGYQRLQDFKIALGQQILIITSSIKFKRYLSFIVIILMAISGIIGGIFAAISWQALYPSDRYGFMAIVLVGIMQGGMLSTIVYAIIFLLSSRFQKFRFL